MTLPSTKYFEPVVTLGNLLTLGSVLVSVTFFFATTHSDVATLRETVKANESKNETQDTQMTVNTSRLGALEEWKSIGPRFTSTDGALLKAGAVAEANAYTNGVSLKMDSQVAVMNSRVDTQFSLINAKMDELAKNLNDVKVIVARVGAIQESGKNNSGN